MANPNPMATKRLTPEVLCWEEPAGYADSFRTRAKTSSMLVS